MMIDQFKEGWLAELEQWLAAKSDEINLFVLIDGAFVPGLFRTLEFRGIAADPIALLFAALPACNEETRDVSPFLVPVSRLDRSLSLVLQKCIGWPTVSAIETTESLDELSRRLSAWCIVEVDDQRFNFRFSDTRRLPKIFATLTPQQRAELTGPMSRWSYIARDGNWEHLSVEGKVSHVASQPTLNEAQFGTLVDDSEPEEVLVQLAYRGFEPNCLPSVSHGTVSKALRIADEGDLPQELRVDWCEFLLKQVKTLDSDADSALAAWRRDQE